MPDKYYCEECRPKLHDLHVDSRGYVNAFLSSPRYVIRASLFAQSNGMMRM